MCTLCTIAQNSAESSILLLKMSFATQQKRDAFQRQIFEKISLRHCKQGSLKVLKHKKKIIKGKRNIQGLHSLRGQRFVTGGIQDAKELKAFCK